MHVDVDDWVPEGAIGLFHGDLGQGDWHLLPPHNLLELSMRYTVVEKSEQLSGRRLVVQAANGEVLILPASRETFDCAKIDSWVEVEYKLVDAPALSAPPHKGTLVLKARRVSPKSDRVYEFKYVPGDDRGVPVAVNSHCAVDADARKFHPGAKGLVPMYILESDGYSEPGGTIYPVRFEVFDFRWEP